MTELQKQKDWLERQRNLEAFCDCGRKFAAIDDPKSQRLDATCPGCGKAVTLTPELWGGRVFWGSRNDEARVR